MAIKNATFAAALDQRSKAIADFEDDQPEISDIANSCMEFAERYLAAYVSKDTIDSTYALLLAQTILSYLEDSFYLGCERKLDQSAALCRMAAEASRVFCRLIERPENERLFLEREKRWKEYRNVFSFRDDVPLERAAKLIYDLCSNYGVHGHFVASSHMEAYDYVHGGEFIELRVPDAARDRNILLWLRTYRAIWGLVVRGLAERNECMHEFRDLMDGFLVSIDKLLTRIERSGEDEMDA